MITTNGFGAGAISVSGWGVSGKQLPFFEIIAFKVYINTFDSIKVER